MEENLLNGIIKEFLKNGKIKSETSYVNGKKEGVFREYHNGKIKSEIYYKDDILDGSYRTYYPTKGTLQEEFNYVAGEKEGEQKTYYSNGKIKSERFYKNNKYHGIHRFYQENGELESEKTWKNGQLDGISNSYGHKRIISNYRLGKLEGLYIEYQIEYLTRKETINKTGYYIDGQEEGLWKHYHQNGQIMRETNYVFGIPVGIEKNYKSDGSLEKVSYYIEENDDETKIGNIISNSIHLEKSTKKKNFFDWLKNKTRLKMKIER